MSLTLSEQLAAAKLDQQQKINTFNELWEQYGDSHWIRHKVQIATARAAMEAAEAEIARLEQAIANSTPVSPTRLDMTALEEQRRHIAGARTSADTRPRRLAARQGHYGR